MSMTYLQQLAVIPALLLTLAGLLALHGPDEEKGKRRFLLFLLVIGVLLLTAVFLTNQPPGAPYRPLSFQLPTLLTPAIVGVLALILLNLKTGRTFNRREKMIAGLLGLALLILSGLLWNSRLSMAYLMLPGAMVLAIAWQLSNRYRRLAVFLSLCALAALFFYNYLYQNQPDPASYVWLRFLLLPTFFIAPALLVGMPALFITMQMQQGTDGQPSGWVNPVRRTKIVRLSLTFLLLGSLLYFLFWGAIWDQTQDMGMGFLALPMVGVTAVVAGMIMTTTLPGKHRIVGVLFMGLVPTLLYQVYELGSSISHHEITESRAGQIAKAIDQFQAREGHYPETLAALRPRDLLFIWQPMILPGESWCYQGGKDFYRLAAFHREFWSSPVSLRVYEAVGEPPSGSWECEARLAAMKERYYSPMEGPAAFQPPMPTPLPTIEVGMPKTVVQPVLDGIPVAVGSWSPDSAYFVFGAKNGTITLHFLNGRTGEICTVDNDFAYTETLRERHVWLPDGRLLYLDSSGEMVILTPCQPQTERLTDRFPETFTEIGAHGEENGRILLQSEGAFWILDGRSLSLQPIPDVTPNLYDLHWDQVTWLPGGERLVISRLDGRSGSNAGATLYLVDGSSGQVETNLHLPGDFGQSAPWVEGLSEAEILLHSSGDWLIVDFNASPPQFTNVLADIFNLDVDFPDEISASGSFVDKGEHGYYLAVRLNHPRNQATYLYHSATGQVHVYDHEHHTLLLFPDGELWQMAKQEGEPTYRDEYDLVWAGQPEAVQPRLYITGHTPREYSQLSLRYLPHTAHLAIAPDGEPYVHPDYLLLNEGDGRFTDSEQDFGDASSFSVVLGDVNGDGLLDIVIGWYSVKVYRNYGSGTFGSHYSVGDVPDGIYNFHIALADLNRDGHLDIFGAGCCGGGIPGNGGMQQVFYPASRVWLGNGAGTFSTTGQSLGQLGSSAVALADLNGDGAPDAFLANISSMDASGNTQRGVPNTIWFNDGQGNFSDSGQQLGNKESYAVVLGDLNGDGFIDAVVGNRGPDEIWFNDGQGSFSDSGQRLGDGLTHAVFLADLDGDGDLDLVVAGEESAQVWLNDGAGQFSQGQRISYNQYEAIALGDVTGDGIVDIFVAGVESYQVWRGVGDGRFTAEPRTSYR